MRTFLDRLFEATGWLAGFFMILTLLAVLSSIFGRLMPVFELHGADAYAGYCMAASAFSSVALACSFRWAATGPPMLALTSTMYSPSWSL